MAEEFYVARGEGANLSTVRAASGDSFSSAIQQLLDENETILFGPSQVKLSLIRSSGEEDAEESTTLGSLLITTESVLFWASEQASMDCDLVVPAVCIDLHAMAEDPVSVYIQVRPSSLSFDDFSIELTIVSTENENNELIFAALCKLVSLHPVDDGEEEEDEQFGQDDMVVRSSTPPVTDEDRESMLEYLDSILVVPPEVEIQEPQVASGQFDDADDDEDEAIL